MNPNALPEIPSFPSFEPLVDAIAEAVVRKIEERRRIDAIAEAVLRRIQDLHPGQEAPALEVAANGADGSVPGEDELYEMVLAVLTEPESGPDHR
jgi:hypothetical protein